MQKKPSCIEESPSGRAYLTHTQGTGAAQSHLAAERCDGNKACKDDQGTCSAVAITETV